MKRNLLSLLLLVSIFVFGQNRKSSFELVDNMTIDFSTPRLKEVMPQQFKIFKFDYDSFAAQLTNVPNRDTFNGISNVIISIPNPEGQMVDYRIVEASSFDEVLQSRFPNIRSFAGNEVANPANVIRFSLSKENGISVTIRSVTNQTTYIIDPFTSDYKQFIVFDRAYSAGAGGKFNCATIDEVKQFGPTLERGNNNTILNNADDGILRRFRLAQSCTAEYSNAFGATSAAQVNLVLAQYNNTLTRCNAIYEQDFNITMQIINQSTNVIYYNPATDPYSDATVGTDGANSNNASGWGIQLQNTLNTSLTGASTTLANNNAVYDIGHLFGASGGGGNAGCIGCVCVSPTANGQKQKGSGYTSPSGGLPSGDLFDIDYVAHEYGHQFGGNHTFTHSLEDNAVNVEPGSGVTIMAYAGITQPTTNVTNQSIAVFHAASIKQITDNVKTKTCYVGLGLATGNAIPVPSAPSTLDLPKGTAFKLVGTGTDADANDVLSYSWEQVDDASGAANLCGQGSATNPAGDSDCIPVPGDTAGPNFRSYIPSNTGTRYFPRLIDHIKNGVTGNTWEVIPNTTANRTLNFRFTVRDNRLGAGNNESVNTAVTFLSNRGPFLVTSQNTTGISYNPNSTQTITWDVNNTNLMTGATNVNIKLSTDGGLTFPITLVSNTPNDGTQPVTLPDVAAPFCRILIEPTANNFYAINTRDFAIGYTITPTCNNYTITPTNTAIPQGSYAGFGFTIPDNVIISDVNITTNITHSRTNQVYAFLRKSGSPNIDVDLFQGGSCANTSANLNGTFDDEAATNAGCPGNNFTMKPLSLLSAYDGVSANGNWTLAVADAVNDTRTGTLNSFVLQICYNQFTLTAGACGTVTTTWNGSTWSNGVPNRDKAVIFAGNFTSTANLEACSLTVNAGANVVVNPNHTFIITNGVTNNGTLTIENNGALRQVDASALNNGNVIVKRNSSGMKRLDYTAWSSPVSNQQLQAFSLGTLPTRFYEYLYTGNSTPTAYQAVTATNNFVKGKGYMIRAANTWPVTNTVYNGQFSGVPFNGNVNVAVGRGYNLLGNPYASPISATKLMNENPTLIGALYFWNNTVSASAGSYPTNNYSSYTLMGGTASASGGQVPNGYIQTGQGFFVRALEFGTITFLNSHREDATVSSQFFRTNNTETTQDVNKHRIWLNLNDENNNYNQILLGYVNGATNGVDFALDGEILDKENSMLYNVINDTEYVIQGKGLPFTDTDEVPLGIKINHAGTYNISLENVDGLFANQNVYIKDKVTNTIHDIKQSPYVFTVNQGTFNNRFSVVYKDTNLTTIEEVSTDTVIVTTNQNITIQAPIAISAVTVYDILGRKLVSKTNVNTTNLSMDKMADAQALVVKIELTNGQTITKKVI
jgi:Metallo-peptidase family M12B Reprolysin-like